jgi:peptide/nickel transport system permease protein
MIGPFLLRRGLQIAATMLLLVLVTFVVLRVAPGGPAQVLLGPDQISPERIADVDARLGLDRSIPEQLWRWTEAVAKGDLGSSYFYRLPAVELVVERLPATLVLGGGALVLAMVIGIPIGAFAATQSGSWLDRVIRSGTIIVMSVPVFWLGIGLIFLFSVRMGWLPSSGTGPPTGDATLGDRLRYLALPLLAMALPTAATLALYTRSAVAEVLRLDYMQTARAKGLANRALLWRHAFRNAAIPVVVQVGMTLPHLLEGSIVVETVFSWPGIGQLTAASVGRRDYPVLLAIMLLVGFGVLLSSLLTDLVQRMIDPRLELR